MSIGIGVIGAGVMGADHARIARSELAGAHLAAVADADRHRTEMVASGAKAMTDADELIADPSVDAIIIASPDVTHHRLVLAAIEVGKPVLCEKPLASNTAECLDIVRAERSAGRPMVQTGFMRRFDPAYREMKMVLDSGELGAVKILHCLHRNSAAPSWFTGAMSVTNAFVHEIDACRWLLSSEFVAATVIPCSGDGDPSLFILETDKGSVVSTEVFMNASYGYHVHAEAVCTKGTISMAQPSLTRQRFDGTERAAFPVNWIPRFADAYRIQNQAWIDGLRQGALPRDASTAWDGLVATCLAEQIVVALQTRQRTELHLPERV